MPGISSLPVDDANTVRFTFSLYPIKNATDAFIDNFPNLAKDEKWDEIVVQGNAALDAIYRKHDQLLVDEARISGWLTSTCFYKGDYPQALKHAERCRDLASEFEDKSLLIKGIYLESAVFRALAGEEKDAEKGQELYQKAVASAGEALQMYDLYGLDNSNLKGKVWFNLGAAHADNPKGDLDKAVEAYTQARECFTKSNAEEDVVRTMIRQGKIHLLKNDHTASQAIIDEVRGMAMGKERILMHVDYLEAQLKFAQNDVDEGMRIARNGHARAQMLGAKKDEERFMALIGS